LTEVLGGAQDGVVRRLLLLPFVASCSAGIGRGSDGGSADGVVATPFGGESIIPTAAEERASYERAVAGELARSIGTMDGVFSARVHLALPGRDPLAAPEAAPPRPRASVLIRAQGGGPGPCVADVRALVAGAVDGLSAGDVSVVVTRQAPIAAPTRPPGRVVPAAWLAAGSALCAGLAVAVLGAVAHARDLRQKLREQQHGRTA
jgi:type III secretion protein J